MADPVTRVAVYIDFDNIVISRYDQLHGRGQFQRDKFRGFDRAGQPADPEIAEKFRLATVDVGAVIDFASSFGTLVLTRAYADWSVMVNADYRGQLVSRAVDLVQLFPAAAYAKNGADIRLAVDAVEDMFRLPDLTHVVIVAGDSDYIALAQRCRRLGRYVVGIGVAGSTSRSLAAACDELVTYDALPGISTTGFTRPAERGGRARAGAGENGHDAAAAASTGPGGRRARQNSTGATGTTEHPAGVGRAPANSGRAATRPEATAAPTAPTAPTPSIATRPSSGTTPATPATNGTKSTENLSTEASSGLQPAVSRPAFSDPESATQTSDWRSEALRIEAERLEALRIEADWTEADWDAEQAGVGTDEHSGAHGGDLDTEDPQLVATRLLERALRLGQEKDDADWLHSSAVKIQMKRMDPSFNEKGLGYRSFSDFVKSREDTAELDESSSVRLIRLAPGPAL